MPKSRKVVYTAITDGYDLHPVLNRCAGWDFVCFAASDVDSEGWTVRRMRPGDVVAAGPAMPTDNVKTARRFKILPHLFLQNYDVSIWIDSSLQFKPEIDLDVIARDVVAASVLMRVRQHPYRRCIYREAEVITELGLDAPEIVAAVVARYRAEGFPENRGLAEAGFLVRRHLAAPVVVFDNAWWAEVRAFSRRDQLSFNYAFWKHPFAVDHVDDKVDPEVETLTRGRDRGPFFNATFNFHPTRNR